MFLWNLDPRLATTIRIVGLALVTRSVLTSNRAPSGSGRGLVVAVLLAIAAIAWLSWTAQALRIARGRDGQPSGLGDAIVLHLLAGAGGALTAASPDSAASACVFVAVVAAGLRSDLAQAVPVVMTGTLGLAVGVLIYEGGALGLLAYTLGLAAALLAASNRRDALERTDQAELLLAQTQRSREEQLRAARLQESARIAREIHDVLAHSLAALTIQLEATGALVARGADSADVLTRIERAHTLARAGLEEVREAVGALRGETAAVAERIEELVADYRSEVDARVDLLIDGDRSRLAGPAGAAILRVVQEAVTNVRKHASGADLSVTLHAGSSADEEVVLLVEDRPTAVRPSVGEPGGLSRAGGGYGLRGMRERAQILGGTLQAGSVDGGWRVELRLPGHEVPSGSPR